MKNKVLVAVLAFSIFFLASCQMKSLSSQGSGFHDNASATIANKEIDRSSKYHIENFLEKMKDVPDQEANTVCNFLFEKFGQEDPDTGFAYVFEIVGALKIEEEEYYMGCWRWIVEDENGRATHVSLITDFILRSDLTVMYECWHPDADTLDWFPNPDLLYANDEI